MKKFKCDNCEREFTRNASLQYHINSEACKKDYEYFCKYCNDGFLAKSSMYRHMRETCKERDENKVHRDGDVYEMIDELRKENEKLATEVNKLKSSKATKAAKTINNTQNINTQNINNGTINNITIVAYGKEDVSQIDREDIIKALKTGFNSTKQLTEAIHFNPKYPHYSNIKRSNYNMKNKIMYHDGENWVTTSDPHMIDDLYNRKRDFIEENIELYQDGLNKYDMTRLQRWLDVADDDHRIIRIKNELRELLFNKRMVSEGNERRLEMNDDGELVEVTTIDSDMDFDGDTSTHYVEIIESDDEDSQALPRESTFKTKSRTVAPRNGRKRKAIARLRRK